MREVIITMGIILGLFSSSTIGDLGHFWHVSDMHLDHTYNSWAGSCGSDIPEERGEYGNYACDAPWALINSSLRAMKDLHPNPDFIIWTGDDTPHIWNDSILNQEVVYELIDNLTTILEEVFPGELVFSALGNHDWSPKSQLPPGPHPLYEKVAARWSNWLRENGSDATDTFKSGAYYTATTAVTNGNVKVIVLNTNLYYENNKLTNKIEDPAGQLQWLGEQLMDAKTKNHKVMIIGHVPPGMFEKHRNKHWFYLDKNDAFLELIRKHSDVIGSMHFAHHHTDSFRIVYDSNGKPVSSLLLAPAVTPWETTLPGVIGGAGNNPSVRLLSYDRQTGTIHNVLQYYLNLTDANINGPEWKLEYDARQYYDIEDFGTNSLHMLALKMKEDKDLFHKYYQANGVLYDPSEKCEGECHEIHYCSITELEYDKYEECMKRFTSDGIRFGMNISLFLCIVFSLLKNV